MAERMRTISFSGKRGTRVLHVEAPGCIVNITKHLTDQLGREVTRVDIQADQYADEPKCHIYDNPTSAEIADYIFENLERIASHVCVGADPKKRLAQDIEENLCGKRNFLGARVIRELPEEVA
jgi:hypothetical protein